MGAMPIFAVQNAEPIRPDRMGLRAATLAYMPELVRRGAARRVATFAMAHITTFPVYQQFVHDSATLLGVPDRRANAMLGAMLAESTRLSDAQMLFITHARSLDFAIGPALTAADRRCQRWSRLSPLARVALSLLLADQRLHVADRLARLAARHDMRLVGQWVDWHRDQARQQRAVLASIWRHGARRLPPQVRRAAWRHALIEASRLAFGRMLDGDRMMARHRYGMPMRLMMAAPAALTALATLRRLAACLRTPRIRA